LLLFFFWENISNRKGKLQDINLNCQLKKKINPINQYIQFYKIIFILYALIIFVFIFLPGFYNHFFYQIEDYNNPSINGVGSFIKNCFCLVYCCASIYRWPFA